MFDPASETHSQDRITRLSHPSGAARSRGILVEIAVTVLLMGAVPVIVRHTSANLVTIGIVRLAIAAAGILIWLAVRPVPARLSGRDWMALALVGFLFGAHWLAYFASIKMASAAIGAIGASTFGIHLVVLGWLIGHHEVRPADLAAVGLAILGSLLVAPDWSLTSRATMGLALAVLSAFLYAFLPIIHQRHAHLPSRIRVLGQFGFALLSTLRAVPALGELEPACRRLVVAARAWGGLHASRAHAVDTRHHGDVHADDQHRVLPVRARVAGSWRDRARRAHHRPDAGRRGADRRREPGRDRRPVASAPPRYRAPVDFG
jgi:drug/metabolite transporter (DMT)-like permease